MRRRPSGRGASGGRALSSLLIRCSRSASASSVSRKIVLNKSPRSCAGGGYPVTDG